VKCVNVLRASTQHTGLLIQSQSVRNDKHTSVLRCSAPVFSLGKEENDLENIS